MPDGLSVLYLVYWGLAEPLGRSLVLPTIRELGSRGVRLTVVSFEKAADLQNRSEISGIRTELAAANVRWWPLRYHKRPKVPATGYDIFQGVAASLLLARSQRVDLIHARTFVAGNMGLLLAALLRRPLVYHNEGYYPDEQIDAGVWRQDSLLYRVARRLESKLYSSATGLVLLSEKSQSEISARANGTAPPSVVVPSCVDLRLFPAPSPRQRKQGGPIHLVYVGNIEGRYLFGRVARFATIMTALCPGSDLRVVTRASEDRVRQQTRDAGMTDDCVFVASVPHAEVARHLAASDVGVHFLPHGRAEHAGSPTKIGEYWATGLPVVVTPNAGDSDTIIAADGVGVVVPDLSDEGLAAAGRQLMTLLADEELPQRCRAAAVRHYSLPLGIERLLALYRVALAR